MLDPRIQQLADVLVRHSIEVRPGDKVLLEAFDIPDEAVACVVRSLAAAGAVPLVETRHNRVLRELYRGATEEQMRLLGRLELARMREMDGYIGLRGGANPSEFADVPAEQMALYQRNVWKPVHGEQRCTHTRWVVLRWPSPSMAQAAGLSTDAFEDFYFRACCFDYSRLERAVAPLKARMERARRIRLTGPGTDLLLDKGEIPVIPCTGRRNVPDGECFTAPLREAVEGTISFNTVTVYQGKTFENVRLTLKGGRIVEATSSDTAALNTILDSDEGARFIGEFSLGFHPFILHPMRDTLFDEKIAGSIHFTPGSAYEIADNGNRSEVHWDLVLIQRPEYGGGEIYFDDELVRKDGLFVTDELAGLNPDRLGTPQG
ncbi:MAG TPA: aminopeptidase [Armatimonadota bacterium]|nr:aminopeptidase [Armatimonadota bacterium]